MPTTKRHPENPVLPLIAERWSPRSFTGEAIPDEVLSSLFEAARWAPSAYNVQPWRFIWARNGTPEWQPIFSTLLEFNQRWGKAASAIVVAASQTGFKRPGEEAEQANLWHAFDAGAAWGYLSLQAQALGWAVHACGGFDAESLRANLGLPADLQPHALLLIGKAGAAGALPEGLRELEFARDRLPLDQLVFHGRP